MKVPIEIAVAYSLMRKRAEENAKFDLVAWIRNKIKTKGTMKKVIKNEGVTIYQHNQDCVVVNGVFSGCVFTMPVPKKNKRNKQSKKEL